MLYEVATGISWHADRNVQVKALTITTDIFHIVKYSLLEE